MSTIRCLIVVSSGITCPFGQLSQSPGYISDSLLTRSPLCIATPCDLHVLATPPAFRLSQDQTLQLNFLARVVPDAPCHGCPLTETDTFTTRVYPRNEFVQTDRIKTIRTAVTAPPPARVDRVSRNDFVFRLRRFELQGSNIFFLAPPGATPEVSNKIDQGRSLLHAPRRCLSLRFIPASLREQRLEQTGISSGPS